jgi:phosphatidylserine/phosphatidylglycerophosphate/cardiolipin synthase-like enzyme
MTKHDSTKRLGLKELITTLVLVALLWGARELLGVELLSDSRVIESEPTGAIQIYFTSPASQEDVDNPYGGLDVRLAEAIDQARKSVDVAAYDFDLERVSAAMVRAADRGVRVRLVTDNDYETEVGPVTLRNAGIPVATDDRDPFMHNKFVIIDGYQVWTGSWNLTDNGTYRNNNNAVVLQSIKLAENYTTEFNEMFEDGAFGASSPEIVPNPRVDLDGILIENIFEAEGRARDRIIQIIGEAESSVLFMAFVFTDDEIAGAIIDQHRAGLRVSGVYEARNATIPGSDIASFHEAGLDILEDGNRYIMHHKVIIVDEEIVITGSYNFSASAADKNDENILIIESQEIAGHYVDEFSRVYAEAKGP